MTATTIFSRPAFAAGPTGAGSRQRFLPGTRLATPTGPRAVESLAEGDLVSTRDGAQPISRLTRLVTPRAEAAMRRTAWPVRVPVGSLGNPQPLRLRADQRVVLEGDQVLEHCDLPRVAVPVGDLMGLRGLMSERPLADLRWIGIELERPALLRVEGVLCAFGADVVDGADRDTVRAAFCAMHAVGMPPLAVV
ncbi:MAG: Hint domain-containing protein [Pseudomonadota bacterium]